MPRNVSKDTFFQWLPPRINSTNYRLCLTSSQWGKVCVIRCCATSTDYATMRDSPPITDTHTQHTHRLLLKWRRVIQHRSDFVCLRKQVKTSFTTATHNFLVMATRRRYDLLPAQPLPSNVDDRSSDRQTNRQTDR